MRLRPRLLAQIVSLTLGLVVLLAWVSPAQATPVTFSLDLTQTFFQTVLGTAGLDPLRVFTSTAERRHHGTITIDDSQLDRPVGFSEPMTIDLPWDLSIDFKMTERISLIARLSKTDPSDLEGVLLGRSLDVAHLDFDRFEPLKTSSFLHDTDQYPDPGLGNGAPGQWELQEYDFAFRGVSFGTYTITLVPQLPAVVLLALGALLVLITRGRTLSQVDRR